MPADVHDLLARRRRDRARLRLDQAGRDLEVIVRLGRRVYATKDSDRDVHLAAQQTYHDAVSRLMPCDLVNVVKLAGLELGKTGWTGYREPVESPTAAVHDHLNRSQR